jgi:hypothetical protein
LEAIEDFINFDMMEAIKIEILNPKALQLIKSLQDLNLIKVSEEPATKLKTYLKKMRKNAATAPSFEDIGDLVKEVRSVRHAKK